MSDAMELLRVTGERYIENEREVYAVFIDLEKAFDRLKWELMNILKINVVNWKIEERIE